MKKEANKFDGYIFHVGKKAVKGWAFDTANIDRPATVNLYINKQLIESRIADEEIKKLADQKIHPTGKCGFTFKLTDNEMKNDIEISVCIQLGKEELQLKKSPRKFFTNDKATFINYRELAKPLFENYQRILILGFPKSGTTALTYKLNESVNNAEIKFEPAQREGLSDVNIHRSFLDIKSNLISKCLYFHKNNNYIELIAAFYNKRIWIIRDPRDNLISSFLYRWYYKHDPNQNSYLKALEKVKHKEKDPEGIPFYEVIGSVTKIDDFLDQQKIMYRKLINQINSLKKICDLHILKYESFIDNNFEELEAYLGFKISDTITSNDTLKRVRRSASKDNWKNWFTKKDEELFRTVYEDALNFFDYENDWEVNEKPYIDKSQASEYMIKINTRPGRIESVLKKIKKKLRK